MPCSQFWNPVQLIRMQNEAVIMGSLLIALPSVCFGDKAKN